MAPGLATLGKVVARHSQVAQTTTLLALSREPSRSSLLAKKVEFFLRGRLVEPLARFGDTIFEEQYELNWGAIHKKYPTG